MPPLLRNAFAAALALLLLHVVWTSRTGGHLFTPALFALAAAWFLAWAAGTEPLHGSLPLLPLGAMALWAWLPASSASIAWSALFTLAFLAAQIFHPPQLRKWFRQFALWFGGAYGAYSLVHEHATFWNRNHFAAFLELLFPIAGWQALRTRNPIYGIPALFAFLGIVRSSSRTGAVLAAAELIALAAIAVGRNRGRGAKWMLVAVLAVLALGLGIGRGVRFRFTNLEADATTSTRPMTARASLAMLRDRPLLGIGLGNWESVYPHYAERDTGSHFIHADNDWLEWAAEGGVPFIGFVLTLAGIAIWNAWREPWSLGLVAVMLHALVEFPLQKPAILSWFVVLLVLSSMARRQERSYSRAT